MSELSQAEREARIARAMRSHEAVKAATEATTAITNALMLVYAGPVIALGIAGLVILAILLFSAMT